MISDDGATGISFVSVSPSVVPIGSALFGKLGVPILKMSMLSKGTSNE